MKAIETIKFLDETNKFKHAVDLFFDINPERRLWILLMLYLGKERSLHIIEGCDIEKYAKSKSCQDPHWHIMAQMSINNSNQQKNQEWMNNCFVWADTPQSLDGTLDELVYGIDVDAHNHTQSKGYTQNLFSSQFLIEIAETFISLSEVWYKENVLLAFDYILKKIQKTYGMQGGLFYQPQEITQLVGKLLNAQEGSVCNPYAGTASYSSIIGENCTYVGQEFSHLNSYIAKLYLLISNKRNAIIERGNPDSIIKNTIQVYDNFVSTPPFGLRIPDHEYRAVELHYLNQSSRLTKNKSIGVYPASICYSNNSSNRQVLTKLVEEDILDTVILLPTNIFSNTSIETAIIVINKNKERIGKVRFIDASDCFLSDGRHNRLDLKKVCDRLDSKDNQIGVSVALLDDIRKNDYKVYPKFYCSVNEAIFPDGYIISELGDIIEPCPSTRRYNETIGHFAKIAELSNDTLDCVRSVDHFEISDIMVSAAKVTEPVILFSMIRDIKPTFCIASQDMPLFVHPNISAYRIKANCNWVSARYLCFELGRRINNVTSGVIPRVIREVLLKTKIGFPSYNVEDQELIVKEAIQQSKLAKAKELGLQEIIDMMKADYINEVRTRKHDMRPYLRELGSVERFIRDYVPRAGAMPDFKDKMERLMDQYHSALSSLSALVEVFSEEEQFGNVECFNIDQYFLKLLGEHIQDINGFELCYERDDSALYEAGLLGSQSEEEDFSISNVNVTFKNGEEYSSIPLYVDIASIDFERMVKNIVENARDHGFIDENNHSYKLQISLSVDAKRGLYQIDFINNGTPLPVGMDKQRYGIRGEKAGATGGTGKGGYIVKSIVDHYKGDYDIFMDEENTVVRILLPISRQNDEQHV